MHHAIEFEPTVTHLLIYFARSREVYMQDLQQISLVYSVNKKMTIPLILASLIHLVSSIHFLKLKQLSSKKRTRLFY